MVGREQSCSVAGCTEVFSLEKNQRGQSREKEGVELFHWNEVQDGSPGL